MYKLLRGQEAKNLDPQFVSEMVDGLDSVG